MRRHRLFIVTIAGALAAASPPAQAAPAFALPPPAALGTQTGLMAPAATMRLVLALKLGDAAGADALARAVSDPRNPAYGKFLTPAQFGARFGARAGDYLAVRQWALAGGLAVGPVTHSRSTVSVAGTVATIEKLFSTRIATFRTSSGQDGFAPAVPPSMPDEIAPMVSGVIGLSSTKRFAPLYRLPAGPRPQGAAGTGVDAAYAPSDFRTAYNIPVLQGARPDTVALFEQGGFTPRDVTTFEKRYRLPKVPITVEGVDGYDGSVNDSGVELEAALDLQTLIGINPGLGQIIVYEDGTDPFSVALLDSLTMMAEDDTAQTISISYGIDEAAAGIPALQAEYNVLVELAAQGQAVFVSSGDEGAFGEQVQSTLNVEDPASQPYATGVGGTTLFTYNNAQYSLETAWGLLPEGDGASGGGASSYWNIPGFQIAELNPGVYESVALRNGGSGTMRNVPDLAADAAPVTGASIYSGINGGWLEIGGTSLSAPLWAGAYSVLNAARKGTGLPAIGFFNPLIYNIGVTKPGTILDILSGTNGFPGSNLPSGYDAAFSYDDVTGWGSIHDDDFLISLFQLGAGVGNQPGQASRIHAVPASTSVDVTWKSAQGATGYLVTVTLQQPQSPAYFVAEAVTQGTAFQVTGLSPASKYLVFITAVGPGGSNIPYGVRFTTAPAGEPAK